MYYKSMYFNKTIILIKPYIFSKVLLQNSMHHFHNNCNITIYSEYYYNITSHFIDQPTVLLNDPLKNLNFAYMQKEV